MLIRFFAAAAEVAGRSTQEIDASDLNAKDLVEKLSGANPDLGPLLQVCALLADGIRADENTPLRDVTQLDVLPPFAGG